MAQWLFDSALNDLDTGGLVVILALETFECLHRADICHAATRNDTLLDCRTCSSQSIVYAVFLLFHLDFGRSADVENRYAARQLGQTLLQLLLVVVRLRNLDARTYLRDAGCDSRFVARTVYYRRILLVEGNLVGGSEHSEIRIFDLHTLVGRYHGRTRQHGDIFEYLLAAIAETGSLAGRDLQRAAQFVYHECRQSLAIDIFGDDKQRTAALCYGLEYAHQLLHRRNLLVGDKDIRLFQLRLHLLGVGDEIGRDITAVELHTLDHIDVRFGPFGLLDGDYTLLIDLLHSLGDEFADVAVIVGRNGGYLLDFREIAAHLLRLFAQRLYDMRYGLVHTAFQVHRIGTRRNVLQADADKRLCQNGCRSGSVARIVIGFRRHLLYHLRTHIRERVFEFDLFRYRYSVLGNLRRTEFLVDNHVAAFGAERYLYCVGQCVYALFEHIAGFDVIFDLLCHNIAILTVCD